MIASPPISPTPTLVNVPMDFTAVEEVLPKTLSKASDLEKGDGGADAASCYEGKGTTEDPLVVRWLENDSENPHNWRNLLRYTLVLILANCTLTVALGSSIYAGAVGGVMRQFNVKETIAVLGLSLYVVGFALGPLIWAPFSEVVGRKLIFLATTAPHTLFIIGTALSPNITCLLITRFLSGFFGSAALNNSAAAIGDTFNASERALAMSLFAAASFLGPVLGPIAGGFMGQYLNWRIIFWLQFGLASITYALGALVPETYSPVLLRRRAAKLTQETGRVHTSEFDLEMDVTETLTHKLFVSSYRPFIMLYRESIVLFIAVYVAVVYGILYLLFGAFGIVFEQTRGWSQGKAGLPFIGVGVGMIMAVITNVKVNQKYARDLIAAGGYLPPEARLPITCVGACCLPVGLFWFAWTVQPSVHFIVPCLATIPFGAGMVFVFLSLTNYMVDTYLMWAASALAANAVFRSFFGAVFPLFTAAMFKRLGNNWALTILAFLTLLLVPIPWVFMRYGAQIRAKSFYAPGHKVTGSDRVGKEVDQVDLQRQENLAAIISRIPTTNPV